MRNALIVGLVCALCVMASSPVMADAVGTRFTYQGQLAQSGVPVNGEADLMFQLYDAATTGSSIGPVASYPQVAIVGGLLNVELTFGAGVFNGEARWLEASVRYPAWDGTGTEPAFVTLTPRQRLHAVPYAQALPGMTVRPSETSMNIVGGWIGNWFTTGVNGATISGGGSTGDDPEFPDFNAISDHFGTVSGGTANRAGDYMDPLNSAANATVSGGYGNWAGGLNSTVGGGNGNRATGDGSTVPGGRLNEAVGTGSLAAGIDAVAFHAHTFVWSDGSPSNFTSTEDSQFLINASGGVGIGTNEPDTQLHVRGDGITIEGGYGNFGALSFRKSDDSELDAPALFALSHRTDGTELWLYGDGDGGYANFQGWDYATNSVRFPANGTTLTVDMNENRVGIGVETPGEMLTVGGVVESRSGGFKFPDGSVQTTASTGGSGDSVWSLNGDHAYYTDGNVGVGYNAPNRKLYVLEDAEQLALPLKLDNPHPTLDESGVGILFSVGGSGGGLVSDTRGKGALAYVYSDTWNRGDFHFLQNDNSGAANPTLADSVVTIRNGGSVGIGTTTPAGLLALGDYAGGTGTSVVQDYGKQLVLGGAFNQGPNTGDAVKLLISEYDNDPGANIYPIFVEDENNTQHFYLRNQGGTLSTYFGGSVGIGTHDLTSPLTVSGVVESTTGGFKFPDGTVQTTASLGGGGGWSLTGNAGTTSNVHFIGTTDNAPLAVRVNNQRAWLVTPRTNGPNLVGGYSGNAASVGVSGAAIGGGGGRRNSSPQYYGNLVYDDFGTIAGGWHNQAGDNAGTFSDAEGATVGGGVTNTASGMFATIGGGQDNQATETGATVPGGRDNEANGQTSLAAGYRAKAGHDGCFVWADSTESDFASTADDQFLIRAANGVAIGATSAYGHALFVDGSAAKPGGGSWANVSDVRTKENIKPLSGALDRLLMLRGVTFDYKAPFKVFGTPGRQIGLIAQEVEKVFPNWVDETPGGTKTVTVRGLEALVVEALREMQEQKDTEIRQLRTTVDAQQAIINELLKRVEALER